MSRKEESIAEKIVDAAFTVHKVLGPGLLEKVYDGIIAKGMELKGIKRMLFFWAVNLGLKYKPYNEN